jgi:hypothetical protein
MKYKLKFRDHTLPKVVRRNRRLIAAGLIGLGALTLGNAISSPVDPKLAVTQQLNIPTGKVALAIEIASGLTTASLTVGSKVDLVNVFEDNATTVSRSAEVLAIGAATSRLGSNGTEILVAVALSESMQVAEANQAGGIQVLLPANQ